MNYEVWRHHKLIFKTNKFPQLKQFLIGLHSGEWDYYHDRIKEARNTRELNQEGLLL